MNLKQKIRPNNGTDYRKKVEKGKRSLKNASEEASWLTRVQLLKTVDSSCHLYSVIKPEQAILPFNASYLTNGTTNQKEKNKQCVHKVS
jgi:hypothetical protein